MTEIFAIFSIFFSKHSELNYIWVSTVADDGRTLLVGRGLNEKSAERSMLSSGQRDSMHDPTGLLKVVMPPGIDDDDVMPDEMMKTISEHLGVPSLFSSKQDSDMVT